MKSKVVNDLQRQLGNLFKSKGIVSAYLFGSQAKGKLGPLSDVDIAIQLDASVLSHQRFQFKLHFLDKLTKRLKTDHVDLVLLEEAPLLLAHRILRDGQLLYCRNQKSRIRNEFRLLTNYLDFQEDLALYASAVLR